MHRTPCRGQLSSHAPDTKGKNVHDWVFLPMLRPTTHRVTVKRSNSLIHQARNPKRPKLKSSNLDLLSDLLDKFSNFIYSHGPNYSYL